MIDLRLVRENPEVVRENLKKRKDPKLLKLLDILIKADKEWRKILVRVNELRAEKNRLSLEIANRKKKGEPIRELLESAESVGKELGRLEPELRELERKVRSYLMQMPNLLHDSVPYGEDEGENVEVRRWGELPKFDFKPKDHIALGTELGVIDIERAARVAGARFYYLKGPLVFLNFALIKLGLELLRRRGFKIFQPPYMLRRRAEESATTFEDFEEMIYKIEGDDLYLIPTAEHALLAFHIDEILDAEQLPLRYAGISPCFRKEAGAHGRDTKGIFRVHQFEKVEQFSFTKPEESWQEHEYLLKNAEEFFQLLEIPYRVVNICTGDIGKVAAKKYDIEAWLPGQAKFREVVSCSNCTDFQARRANIRFRTNDGKRFVHTLNSTLVATERALIAIMENYQQADGSILIPKALRPLVGAKRITKNGFE